MPRCGWAKNFRYCSGFIWAILPTDQWWSFIFGYDENVWGSFCTKTYSTFYSIWVVIHFVYKSGIGHGVFSIITIIPNTISPNSGLVRIIHKEKEKEKYIEYCSRMAGRAPRVEHGAGWCAAGKNFGKSASQASAYYPDLWHRNTVWIFLYLSLHTGKNGGFSTYQI